MMKNQSPRIIIEPKAVATDGDGAAMLMREYGYTLDKWQKNVVDCWLGTNVNNEYVVTSGGLSLARQNGKNVCLEARVFYGLVVNHERVLWTSHQVRTVKKAFRRLEAMFTDKRHPEIQAMVKRIRYGIGEESIELNNGGSIEFTARSRQAARGYDGISLVIYDEAQELTDEQAEAIMAVLSASNTGTRQLLYTGTPPYPGCNGDVFRRLRSAALGEWDDRLSKRISWHEWSVDAESVEDIDISDKQIWYKCNPALGTRLTIEFTEAEMNTLTPAGFARERLGWWSPIASKIESPLIDEKTWKSCKSKDGKPEGKTAYGIKFAMDGSTVTLCGAVIPIEGPARISLIDQRPVGMGLTWLAEWLNERYMRASCVVVDGRNGADVLIDKICGTWKIKNSVIKPTAQNVAAAAALLINELNEKTVTWYEKQEALEESALTATRRQIGQGWGFGGPESAPIEAASLALWGCRNTKRNPGRKMRIG